MNINQESQKRLFFLDGAMGTMLQKKGLQAGECPETWNTLCPEKVAEVHREYIRAGVDIVNTNTFGGNRFKLAEYNLEDKLVEINRAGVEAAKMARDAEGSNTLIAGSIGPTGEFLAPMGSTSFETMYDVYYEQVKALADAGADVINFETMVDIGELRAAVLAAKDACDLPIFAHLTFTDSGRTLTGSDPISGFNILEGLGVDFVGMNCGLGPDDMAELMKGINANINTKMVIQANAGVPKLVDGKTVFTCSVHDYTDQLEAIVKEGVNVIGGCCGTTPEFMAQVIKKFKDAEPKKIDGTAKNKSVKISSPSRTVMMNRESLFCKIGEKINPSALKKVAQDIRTNSTAQIKEVAKAQEEAGAHILDVNLGLGGSDEVTSFERVIPELQSFTQVPFCIDTTHPEALKKALQLYPGRALINSISGESDRLKNVLPLMARYGSYAILLPLNDEGIPDTVDGRMQVIADVLKSAEVAGVPSERFVVDALVMTASASPELAQVSLDTVERAHKDFGLFSTCGLSNISFGLPGRNAINASFLAMLMGVGLDSAILNPQDDLMNVIIDAGNVLKMRDMHAGAYIEKHQATKNFFKEAPKVDVSGVLQKKLLSFMDKMEG